MRMIFWVILCVIIDCHAGHNPTFVVTWQIYFRSITSTSRNTSAAFARSEATRLATMLPASRRKKCIERRSSLASFSRTAIRHRALFGFDQVFEKHPPVFPTLRKRISPLSRCFRSDGRDIFRESASERFVTRSM